jgi:hypothetical protein
MLIKTDTQLGRTPGLLVVRSPCAVCVSLSEELYVDLRCSRPASLQHLVDLVRPFPTKCEYLHSVSADEMSEMVESVQ